MISIQINRVIHLIENCEFQIKLQDGAVVTEKNEYPDTCSYGAIVATSVASEKIPLFGSSGSGLL